MTQATATQLLAANPTAIVSYRDLAAEPIAHLGVALGYQEAYLRVLMGFLGVTDIEVIRAENVGHSEAAQARPLPARWSSRLHANSAHTGA